MAVRKKNLKSTEPSKLDLKDINEKLEQETAIRQHEKKNTSGKQKKNKATQTDGASEELKKSEAVDKNDKKVLDTKSGSKASDGKSDEKTPDSKSDKKSDTKVSDKKSDTKASDKKLGKAVSENKGKKTTTKGKKSDELENEQKKGKSTEEAVLETKKGRGKTPAKSEAVKSGDAPVVQTKEPEVKSEKKGRKSAAVEVQPVVADEKSKKGKKTATKSSDKKSTNKKSENKPVKQDHLLDEKEQQLPVLHETEKIQPAGLLEKEKDKLPIVHETEKMQPVALLNDKSPVKKRGRPGNKSSVKEEKVEKPKVEQQKRAKKNPKVEKKLEKKSANQKKTKKEIKHETVIPVSELQSQDNLKQDKTPVTSLFTTSDKQKTSIFSAVGDKSENKKLPTFFTKETEKQPIFDDIKSQLPIVFDERAKLYQFITEEQQSGDMAKDKKQDQKSDKKQDQEDEKLPYWSQAVDTNVIFCSPNRLILVQEGIKNVIADTLTDYDMKVAIKERRVTFTTIISDNNEKKARVMAIRFGTEENAKRFAELIERK